MTLNLNVAAAITILHVFVSFRRLGKLYSFVFVLQMTSTVFILLCATTTIKSDEHGVFFKVEENRFLITDGNVVWSEKVDSLLSCSQICARRDDCQSANFMKDRLQQTCLLLRKGRSRYPAGLLKRAGCFYLEKVGWKSFVSISR